MVDAAERIDADGHRRLDLILVADVGNERKRLPSSLFHEFRGLLEIVATGDAVRGWPISPVAMSSRATLAPSRPSATAWLRP